MASGGNKIVAPSRNGDDVAVPALAVAKSAAQSAHLNLEIRFFDVRFRPGPRDQFLFADHLASACDQSGQDVKGAAAESHRLTALEQEPLRCKEPVRAKRDRVFVHGGRSPESTNFTQIYLTGARATLRRRELQLQLAVTATTSYPI